MVVETVPGVLGRTPGENGLTRFRAKANLKPVPEASPTDHKDTFDGVRMPLRQRVLRTFSNHTGTSPLHTASPKQ